MWIYENGGFEYDEGIHHKLLDAIVFFKSGYTVGQSPNLFGIRAVYFSIIFRLQPSFIDMLFMLTHLWFQPIKIKAKANMAGDTFFRRLQTGHMCSLWILIGSLVCLGLLLFLGSLTTFLSELSTSTAVKLTSSYCYLLTEESVLIVVKGERMFFRSHTCKQRHARVITPASTRHFFTILSDLRSRWDLGPAVYLGVGDLRKVR